MQLFNEYAGHEGDDSLREKLINSLMCYAALDLGNGIVARRSAVEGAIEIDDDEFLLRLRSITVGSYAFSGFEAGLSATLEERSEILQYVTGWDVERTGAEIICLGVEQTTAQDFVQDTAKVTWGSKPKKEVWSLNGCIGLSGSNFFMEKTACEKTLLNSLIAKND